MWTALIGPLAGLMSQWFENKREESKAKSQAKLEVIKNKASWEELMANASASSWKDEMFSIILSMPILFVGWGALSDDPAVIDRLGLAFDQLSSLPDWYHYLLGIAVTASFGVRGSEKVLQLMRKK